MTQAIDLGVGSSLLGFSHNFITPWPSPFSFSLHTQIIPLNGLVISQWNHDFSVEFEELGWGEIYTVLSRSISG